MPASRRSVHKPQVRAANRGRRVLLRLDQFEIQAHRQHVFAGSWLTRLDGAQEVGAVTGGRRDDVRAIAARLRWNAESLEPLGRTPAAPVRGAGGELDGA